MAENLSIINVIDLYRTGRLELDCSEIALVQDVAETPCSYRGPGYVRQNQEGEIRFKLFRTEALNPPPRGSDGHTRRAGTIIASHEYYKLAAIDALGRRWIGDRIIPSLSNGGERGEIISAEGLVYVLVHVEALPFSCDLGNLKLHFFQGLDFPCNSNTKLYIDDDGGGPEFIGSRCDLVKLKSADCDITIRKAVGALTVEVDVATPFPADLETRIPEALQFVLARSLWCRAVECRLGSEKTTKLISSRPVSGNTRLHEPICLTSWAAQQDIWRLFDRYFQYIVSCRDLGWHPCSIHLHAACEASANSMEAFALGLAVAVEGMANSLFRDLAQKEPMYENLVRDLCNHVGKWSPGEDETTVADIRRRIEGFRGPLQEVRAIDRMYALARLGAIEESYIKAWKGLRNSSAHAGAPGKPLNQQLVDKVMTVTVLMYEMVFHAIGYEGRYTDYSTQGFPARSYPSRNLAPIPTAGSVGAIPGGRTY